MSLGLRKAWTGLVQPLLRRPPQLQAAALCLREGSEGTQVLLITSRDTGRWILPKGWLMTGTDAAGAARVEAWEEAGVKDAEVERTPLGRYYYNKRLDTGYETPVEVPVYRLRVRKLADDYPEADQRRREWVSPQEAARRVDEPGLKELLLHL